jgi:hypothetical protein
VREIETLVSRFPRHVLAIRRLYAADARFRTICGDYDEALRALRYWQAAGASSDCRIEQYRELLDDLESEILNNIGGAEKYGSGRKDWLAPRAARSVPWGFHMSRRRER